MKKMYALMAAGLLVITGAFSSPASARGHNNWKQNARYYNNWNRASYNNNWNRAYNRQQSGGPWVNAEIAAQMQAAKDAQQNAYNAARFNPYYYGRNPYYGNYSNRYYGNNIYGNGYYNSGGLLNRFLGRYY